MYKNHIKDTNNNYNKSLLPDHKEKLIQAIKRIKHEVDECWEAERETYIWSVDVERCFDHLEREVRAEFQNLHRFLDEEETMDMERLKKEKEKRVKLLREREKKIAMQGRDLERGIATLNNKLAEEDSPKLLKVPGGFYTPSAGGCGGAISTLCGAHPVQDMETHEELPVPKYH